jgi:hypothetical protein
VNTGYQVTVPRNSTTMQRSWMGQMRIRLWFRNDGLTRIRRNALRLLRPTKAWATLPLSFQRPLDHAARSNTRSMTRRIETRVRSNNTSAVISGALRQNSDLSANPVAQFVRVHCAGLAGDFTTIFENDERGDTANIETAGSVRIRIGIEFRETHGRFELFCDPLKVRRHHFAGPAPFCPEIDYDRDAAAFYVCGKTAIGEFDRPACEQWLFTLTTGWVIAKPRFRNPVDRITPRAGDMIVIVHFVHPLRRFTQHGAKCAGYKGLACTPP